MQSKPLFDFVLDCLLVCSSDGSPGKSLPKDRNPMASIPRSLSIDLSIHNPYLNA